MDTRRAGQRLQSLSTAAMITELEPYFRQGKLEVENPPGSDSYAANEVEQRIRLGELSLAEVERALAFWMADLQRELAAPSGLHIHIPQDTRYHLLLDPRVRRHPERIRLFVESATTIYTEGSRALRILSAWVEPTGMKFAYGIVDIDGRLRTMHVLKNGLGKQFRRADRRGEQLIWRSL